MSSVDWRCNSYKIFCRVSGIHKVLYAMTLPEGLNWVRVHGVSLYELFSKMVNSKQNCEASVSPSKEMLFPGAGMWMAIKSSGLGLAPTGCLRTCWCGSKMTNPAHKMAGPFAWGQEWGMMPKEEHKATLDQSEENRKIVKLALLTRRHLEGRGIRIWNSTSLTGRIDFLECPFSLDTKAVTGLQSGVAASGGPATWGSLRNEAQNSCR